jgi:hypothetical protein
MGEINKILARKLLGMRLLGKPRCSWECNIKINLKEIESNGMDWIKLVHNRIKHQVLMTI